jgi:hypothetical protein
MFTAHLSVASSPASVLGHLVVDLSAAADLIPYSGLLALIRECGGHGVLGEGDTSILLLSFLLFLFLFFLLFFLFFFWASCASDFLRFDSPFLWCPKLSYILGVKNYALGWCFVSGRRALKVIVSWRRGGHAVSGVHT